MNNLNNNDNIFFYFEEKDDDKNTEEDIVKMMEEFNGVTNNESEYNDVEEKIDEFTSWLYDNNDSNLEYFINKAAYGNDETFYEEEYTVKDLIKICNYYGIDKDIRSSKCKKQDIICTLIYFESLPENFEIVQKRHRMWAYITELLNDPKMKKFIIFS